MAVMLDLTLDYELIEAVSQNLDDTHWPVRMMSLYLLAKLRNSNFKKVLDWTAKYDSNELVRDMAIALGTAVPEEQKPAAQPAPDDSDKQSPKTKG